MEQATDSFLMVVEASCRYLRPLRYDMEFVVRTSVKDFRKKTLTFSYQILDHAGEALLAKGETKHVIADKEGRLKSFPIEYRKFFE